MDLQQQQQQQLGHSAAHTVVTRRCVTAAWDSDSDSDWDWTMTPSHAATAGCKVEPPPVGQITRTIC